MRHLPLFGIAQTGTLVWHSISPLHVTPPQCSAVTGGDAVVAHCVSERSSEPERASVTKVLSGDRDWDILPVYISRAQRNPTVEVFTSGARELR